MKSIYFLAIVIFYLCSKLNAQYIGSACLLENGLNGVCNSIANCPSAAALIQKRKQPQLCEFIAEDPIVCCAQNVIVNSKNKQYNLYRAECDISKNLPLINNPSEFFDDTTLKIVKAAQRLRVERTPRNIKNKLGLDIHNVAGGVRVKRAEFPHMVRLGIGENETDIEWFCGGSLISDKFILTAAHCIYSRLGVINKALLGDPTTQFLQRNIEIIKNILHPRFNYSQHYHDIALSELKDRISFRLNIQPACLYVQREIPTNTLITVTGWGSTEHGGLGSRDLLKADVSLFTQQECNQKYNTSLKKLQRGIDEETQFCAGGRTEVKDTCQGDSGGPIQLKTINTYNKRIYPLIGITSFGKICGFVNQPGVYTRIYPYLDWIESIMFNSTST